MLILQHKPIDYDYISQPYKKLKHKGIDLVSKAGKKAKIYAVADGVVSACGKGALDWSYGNEVFLSHGNGYYTNYGHLSKILVKKGQKVKTGDVIGYQGSTGRSTGIHLHFEVWNGKSFKNRIDPKPFLDNIGAPRYKVGKTYTVQRLVNVRIGHSTDSPRVGYAKLSANARQHADAEGRLLPLTKVTVKDIYINGNTCWLKTPSGWVCGYSKNTVYVK